MKPPAPAEVVRQSVVVDVALALLIGATLVGVAGYSGLAGIDGGAALALAVVMLGTAFALLMVGALRSWRARARRRTPNASLPVDEQVPG